MIFSLAEVFLLVWGFLATVLAVMYRGRVMYLRALVTAAGHTSAAVVLNDNKREEARKMFAEHGITSEADYIRSINK